MPHEDHEKNRLAWNEMVEVHFKHPDYKVKEFLNGASTLKRIELDELGDVNKRTLLHLMCQFGLDTLSWARRGAIVTGTDISDQSIERARELTKKTRLPATFVRSDVLELTGKIDTKFDIVFQSYGTHHWLSDLTRWAQTVDHYLKPGGVFYMVDIHPIAVPFIEPTVSYFRKGPYRYTNEIDYCDKDYRIKNELVEWQHTLADIVNALIGVGLQIKFVNEFDKLCYARERDWIEKDGYYYPPDGSSRLPLMFSLKAVK